MKVGGFIIYHGPLGEKSVQLVEYFEVHLTALLGLAIITASQS